MHFISQIPKFDHKFPKLVQSLEECPLGFDRCVNLFPFFVQTFSIRPKEVFYDRTVPWLDTFFDMFIMAEKMVIWLFMFKLS